MKIGTMSVVVGTGRCNAKCPFCVSKLTGKEKNYIDINWRNFEKSTQLAKMSGVTTILLTGKGEPTLYPDMISQYLSRLHDFPFIELQTNALNFHYGYEKHLKNWYNLGLTTICISMVHYDNDKNKEIYGFDYDLPQIIDKLHKIGYSVRLNNISVKGYIDSKEEVINLIDFCKENNVEQLTCRPVSFPDDPQDKEAYKWVKEHKISNYTWRLISNYMAQNGNRVMTLQHGGVVYDYKGQNICLTGCLTIEPDTDNLRQIIFFPDGSIRYDWRYKGARLL